MRFSDCLGKSVAASGQTCLLNEIKIHPKQNTQKHHTVHGKELVSLSTLDLSNTLMLHKHQTNQNLGITPQNTRSNGPENRYRHSFTMKVDTLQSAHPWGNILVFVQDTSQNYEDVQARIRKQTVFSDQCRILLSLQSDTPLIFSLRILQTQDDCQRTQNRTCNTVRFQQQQKKSCLQQHPGDELTAFDRPG
jgi:hypothetical protein